MPGLSRAVRRKACWIRVCRAGGIGFYLMLLCSIKGSREVAPRACGALARGGISRTAISVAKAYAL